MAFVVKLGPNEKYFNIHEYIQYVNVNIETNNKLLTTTIVI